MNKLLRHLQGGDLRSLGDSNNVVERIKSQEDSDLLFQLLSHEDRKVAMRAADVIEKITLRNPGFLTSHKKEILRMCSDDPHIELKWHLALILPRLTLTRTENQRVWKLLTNWCSDERESRIVRVNALQALFELQQNNQKRWPNFSRTVKKIRQENIPSLNARLRKLNLF